MSKSDDSHPRNAADPAGTRTTHCAVCRRPLERADRGRPRRYCSRSCRARAYRAGRDGRAPEAADHRPPRPTRLTRVTIARTAVALADRDGLAGLTMRRLAGELGVATAALYRHYPDREALLSAMTELVLAEHACDELPAPAEPRAALAGEASREWRLYRDHPWMLPTLARLRPPLGPALFDTLERSFAVLDRLDIPAGEMLTTYLALSGLVQGLALLRISEPGQRTADDTGARDDPSPEELAELLAPTLRPALHRALAGVVPVPAPDLDELFTGAVDLLLDGITHRHAARRTVGRALHDAEPTE
ncbi:TetR/AcrR family transcriptional regulator [Nocardia higoensis]|uniref:TetR/AcrR family transcriptional regulator n=1 Tax=Nocardia higoensis TaxID=228599 RepID=UPI0009FF8F33|nr:TetR/AcrR family transcriptional regulator [Nocardia higoensis]